MFVPLLTSVLAALIASSTVFFPVPPIFVMVKLPFGPTVALPPKTFLVELATLPKACWVKYN